MDRIYKLHRRRRRRQRHKCAYMYVCLGLLKCSSNGINTTAGECIQNFLTTGGILSMHSVVPSYSLHRCWFVFSLRKEYLAAGLKCVRGELLRLTEIEMFIYTNSGRLFMVHVNGDSHFADAGAT